MTREELVEKLAVHLGEEAPSASRFVDVLQAVLGLELLDGPIDFAGIGRLDPYAGDGSWQVPRAKPYKKTGGVVVRARKGPFVFPRYPGTRDPGPDASIPVVLHGTQRRPSARPGATTRFTTVNKAIRPQR